MVVYILHEVFSSSVTCSASTGSWVGLVIPSSTHIGVLYMQPYFDLKHFHIAIYVAIAIAFALTTFNSLPIPYG